MNLDKDYYAVLGVLPSVDSPALTDAYRGLLKKYHPDVYKGRKSDAERITKELVEAYRVLGNAKARRAYDVARKGQSARPAAPQRDGRRPSASGTDDTSATRWEYIVRYYPEAEGYRAELALLSAGLASSYQALLSGMMRPAENARQLRTKLKREFLERHFGTNESVQQFALEALKAGRRDVAREVNRSIKRHGSPAGNADRFLTAVLRVTGWRIDDGRFHPLMVAAGLRRGRKRLQKPDQFVMLFAIGAASLVVLALVAILSR
jgi:curved DNA-binding protein CbpA